ncbi:Peptidyl-prolyl cis-trans isomerase [Pseudomonas syringae pv. maculicola]|nr:Peptidyl-prolyl cis-trans isomerase [Pseudomonas syringae pv. maculicola]QQN19918.1 FKBP-type peptidyl-prolyl cis-trans isomerase [Pseudomonas cannabina pv. alisalensis]
MGMQVGGKRRLFVPAHLAYGERSIGAHIKPGADLRFEIELLEVLTRDD